MIHTGGDAGGDARATTTFLVLEGQLWTSPGCQFRPFRTSEGGHDLDFLAWADHQVGASRPDRIVQQKLERQLFGSRRGPPPGIGIDTLAWNSSFPAQPGSLAAKIT